MAMFIGKEASGLDFDWGAVDASKPLRSVLSEVTKASERKNIREEVQAEKDRLFAYNAARAEVDDAFKVQSFNEQVAAREAGDIYRTAMFDKQEEQMRLDAEHKIVMAQQGQQKLDDDFITTGLKQMNQEELNAAKITADNAQTDESRYALKIEKNKEATRIFNKNLQAGLDSLPLEDLKKLSTMTPEDLKKNYATYFPGLVALPEGSASDVQKKVNATLKFQKTRIADNNRVFAEKLKDSDKGAVKEITEYAKKLTVSKDTAHNKRITAMKRLDEAGGGTEYGFGSLGNVVDAAGMGLSMIGAGVREWVTNDSTDAVNDTAATIQYNKEFLQMVGPTHTEYQKIYIETQKLDKKLRIMKAEGDLAVINDIKSEKDVKDIDKIIKKVK